MEYFYTSLPPAALLPRPPRPTVERIIERAIARRIVSIGGSSGTRGWTRSEKEPPAEPHV